MQAVRLKNFEKLVETNGGKREFAKRYGLNTDYVSQLLSGHRNIGEKAARNIEEKVGLSPYLLETGIGEQYDKSNIERIQANAVPLISWVSAGKFCGPGDVVSVEDAEEWLQCPVKHSARTYALRVRGVSMYNPSGRPSFSDGDVIFVDPAREAINNSLVVAMLEGGSEATFKRLLIEGAERMLEALNPAYPERYTRIDKATSICGVVIAKLESLI